MKTVLINYLPSAKPIETTSTLLFSCGLMEGYSFFFPLGWEWWRKVSIEFSSMAYPSRIRIQTLHQTSGSSLLKVVNSLKIQFIFILLYPYTFYSNNFFFSTTKNKKLGLANRKWRILVISENNALGSYLLEMR